MDLTTMRPYRMEFPRGPMPTGNNIWVTTGAAKDYGWSVGSRVTVNGHRYTITGVVREEWPGNGPTFWVAPRSPLARGGELTYYVNGASLTRQQVEKLNASGVGVADRRAEESASQGDTFERDMFALILARWGALGYCRSHYRSRSIRYWRSSTAADARSARHYRGRST